MNTNIRNPRENTYPKPLTLLDRDGVFNVRLDTTCTCVEARYGHQGQCRRLRATVHKVADISSYELAVHLLNCGSVVETYRHGGTFRKPRSIVSHHRHASIQRNVNLDANTMS